MFNVYSKTVLNISFQTNEPNRPLDSLALLEGSTIIFHNWVNNEVNLSSASIIRVLDGNSTFKIKNPNFMDGLKNMTKLVRVGTWWQ